MCAIRSCRAAALVGLTAAVLSCTDSPRTLLPTEPSPARFGAIDITVATIVEEGGPIDLDGYSLSVDGTPALTVGANGKVTIPGLRTGAHLITLWGVASNCRVHSPNPQQVTVVEGTPVTIAFDITCDGPKEFAFITYANGTADIHLFNGTSATQLTSGNGFHESPSWSPDGKKIAFVRTVGGNADIYVMEANGQNQVRLTNASGADRGPTWSPDGNRIAFTSERDHETMASYRFSTIYTMNSDGTNQVRITSGGAHDLSPDWSPDGTRIAFSSDREGSFGIWLIAPNGLEAARLTSVPQRDNRPTWSPDGTKLAFERPAPGTGRMSIFTMNADGSEATHLTSAYYDAQYPTWSPTGKKIAFTVTGDPNTSACGWWECDPFVEIIGLDRNPYPRAISQSASQPAWRPR
jgi:tricorn protease-like protein